MLFTHMEVLNKDPKRYPWFEMESCNNTHRIALFLSFKFLCSKRDYQRTNIQNMLRYQWRIQDFPWGGGNLIGGCQLPRRLCFKNFVCQNERIWTLGGGSMRAGGASPGSATGCGGVQDTYFATPNWSNWPKIICVMTFCAPDIWSSQTRILTL